MVDKNTLKRAYAARSGFTIVELLIVVVVIAILAAIIIVSYNGITRQAEISAADTHLNDLTKKVELYNAANGVYPTYAGQVDGFKSNDFYLYADTLFCVETTNTKGATYHRRSDTQKTVEAPCGNIAANYPIAPESCFLFNTATRAIEDYYDNQNNNPASPACPERLTIPSTISGLTPLIIRQAGFSSSFVKGVVIASTITTINEGGFGNSQLDYVYIPSSVTTIEHSGFGSTNLTSLYIPSTVTTLGCGILFNTSALRNLSVGIDATASTPSAELDCTLAYGSGIENLIVGQHITAFKNGVFANASSLKNLTIKDGDRPLIFENGSFRSSMITNLSLPGRTVAVRDGSFSDTPSLKSVTIAAGSNDLSINNAAFGYEPTLERVSLPSNTKRIEVGAFYNLPAGVAIEIHASVSNLVIESRAFEDTKMTSFTFPRGVSLIETDAFLGSSITSVSVSNSTTIQANAFPAGTTVTRY